jgi:uncharacterized membrane protein (UPF0127 family)
VRLRRAIATTRRVACTSAFSYLVVAVLLAALLSACNSGDGEPVPTGSDGAPLTRITFVNKEGDEIDLFVEVVDTPEERGRGLMFRESMPENQGMLFVFEEEGQYSFYMRDTPLPLSIAFIEGEGDIIEIEDMQPHTEDLHSPDEPYLYAVEVNQGWFERNGIGAGAGVRIARLTTAPSPSTS